MQQALPLPAEDGLEDERIQRDHSALEWKVLALETLLGCPEVLARAEGTWECHGALSVQ